MYVIARKTSSGDVSFGPLKGSARACDLIGWPAPNANERVSIPVLRRATGSCPKRDCYPFEEANRDISARPSDFARTGDLGNVFVDGTAAEKHLFPSLTR